MASLHPLVFTLLLAGCAQAASTGEGDVQEAPEPNQPGERTLTAEDIEQNPSEPIERLLANRFPGVVVTRSPNGGIAVRIRGRTSILGSNEPLYVIDGVPIQPGPGGPYSGSTHTTSNPSKC